MNALINYPGSKWGMAKEIISLMPPHRSYLEPFFGSGAVLFNKPSSPIETVNDIDGEVVNFFRVLREAPDYLAELIEMTPYAREVYEQACRYDGRDKVRRAYSFAIHCRMAHGFRTCDNGGFKTDICGRESAYCVRNWNQMPTDVLAAASRLKDVQIENRPALELIRRWNYPDVLIYADPPYLLDTRGGKLYRHEMTEQDHVELLVALLQHKGAVILSGYPSELYDRELKGWSRITRRSYNQNKDPRTEVLWCNFELPEQIGMEAF